MVKQLFVLICESIGSGRHELVLTALRINILLQWHLNQDKCIVAVQVERLVEAGLVHGWLELGGPDGLALQNRFLCVIF